MDPNTILAEMREQWLRVGDASTEERAAIYLSVATHFAALDDWFSRGGFFPSEWTEAQRRALENTRCERPTLAGTTVPVPCPPTHTDQFANELGTREIGAYDDPAVQRAIHEHLRTNPWDGR